MDQTLSTIGGDTVSIRDAIPRRSVLGAVTVMSTRSKTNLKIPNQTGENHKQFITNMIESRAMQNQTKRMLKKAFYAIDKGKTQPLVRQLMC